MELVSIIIPAYNVESYIEQCIKSVIEQSYKNLEVIVINDGSTDSTLSLLMKLKEKYQRIKVVSWQNQGPSAARNLGIEIANGSFLFFLDGDDWLNSNCIERMMEVQQQEGSDIVVADHMRFRMEDSKFLIHITNDYYTKTYSVKDWFENMEEENGGITFTVPWGKLYKKELFEALRYPFGLIMEDNYTTYLAYLLSNRISYTNEALYVYRVTPTGIVSTASKIEAHPLKPLEEEITLLSMLEMNADVAKKRYFCRLKTLKNEFSSMASSSYEYYKVRTFLEILKKHGYTE